MSFGGSVSAMISSLKNNKNLLSKRDRFHDKKENLQYRKRKALKYKELPETELNELKHKIRSKFKRQRLVSVFVVIIVATLLMYFAIKLF